MCFRDTFSSGNLQQFRMMLVNTIFSVVTIGICNSLCYYFHCHYSHCHLHLHHHHHIIMTIFTILIFGILPSSSLSSPAHYNLHRHHLFIIFTIVTIFVRHDHHPHHIQYHHHHAGGVGGGERKNMDCHTQLFRYFFLKSLQLFV